MNTTTTRRLLSATAAAGVISLASALPVAAEPDEGWPGSTGQGGSTTSDTGSAQIREVLVDDDSLEYVQIGLGALAGMAIAGAAVVTVRRRGHHAPHPA